MKGFGQWCYRVLCPASTIMLGLLVVGKGFDYISTDMPKFILSIFFLIWFVFQGVVAAIYAFKEEYK